MRTLVYVQSREERSQIRPFLSRFLDNIIMVNSGEELLERLGDGRGFDFIILDDTFDSVSPDGEALFSGPTIPEIMRAIQTQYTENSAATILCFLRPAQKQDAPGMSSFYSEPSVEDRRQSYIELGIYNFLEKPFTIETLNQTLANTLAMAEKPPQWLLVLRQARALVSANKLKEAYALLTKLHEMGFEKEHLGFAILRSRVLTLLGGPHLAEANKILKSLETLHPSSISIRLNRLENEMKLLNYSEAFAVQISIFEQQKTTSNFEKMLELLHEIDKALTTDPSPTPTLSSREMLLLENTQKIFAVLLKDPPQYSRKLRPQVLGLVALRIQHHEAWYKLLKLFEQAQDMVSESLPTLRLVLSSLKPHANDQYPAIREAFEAAHFFLHKADPVDPQAIEVSTRTLMQKKDVAGLEKLLETSREAGAKSLEFYTCYAEYFLHIGMLKEASDTLHKAVQIQADDPRVLNLRESWQQAYTAKAA